MNETRPRWRFLPEPFWWTLLAMLGLSVMTSIPVFIVAALIWSDSTSPFIYAVCYVISVPITWGLIRAWEAMA